VQFEGPSPAAISVTGSDGLWSIGVQFTNAPSNNLTFSDTEGCQDCCAAAPDPFEVQSSTGTWVRASSVVQFSQAFVEVVLPLTQKPVALRYAWTDRVQCVVRDPVTALPFPPYLTSLAAAAWL